MASRSGHRSPRRSVPSRSWAPSNRTAKSNAHGTDGSFWAEWAIDEAAGDWLIEPTVGIRVARYGQGAWTEDGAGALSLAADAQALTASQLTGGARVARRSGRLRPYGEALYARELGAADVAVAMRLSSEPAAAFTVSGVPFASDRLLAAAGIATAFGRGTDLTIGYRVDAGSTGARHSVDLGVRF